MSNYTAQEVQDAVEKIVRSSVRHPTGILGDRKIDVSFSDIQEAAAGVYILWFNAPFYTILLGASKLKDLVQTQASTVSSLIDAVFATDRLVTPVKDLSPLANARGALEELEAAVSARDQGFTDISKVPAYRRYVQNLDGFLNTIGPNIKSQGTDPSSGESRSAIVDTPSGARSKIPALVRSVVDQHAELVRRAKLLAGAIADFSSLNLPRVAAQGVISRARDVLDGHYNTLSALDENARLDSLRAVALDLLTQKPLVAKYGAAQAPGEFIFTSGSAQAFADADHPATPASITSDIPGPYPILADNQFIRFTMDGGAPFDYPLPLSFIAGLDGRLQEPFQIDADRDALLIGFGNVDTGLTQYPVALTNGLRTAAQVVAQINAALGASGLVCEEAFYPVRYTAPVVITSLGGNNARFTILGGGLNGLGIVVGDEVDVNEGANDGTTWVVTAVDLAGQFINALGVAPVVPVPLPGAMIEVGPAARALRFRDTDEATSLSQRRTVQLIATGGDEDLAASVLGFFPGISARSTPVPAIDVAANINGSTSRLKASVKFEAEHYTGVARSEPTDPTRIVFTNGIGTGAIITGGTLVTIVVLSMEHHLTAALDVGDILVLRASTVPGDVGQEGTITALNAVDIEVLFATPVGAGNVSFEVGPDVNFGFGDVVVINDGPNAGRYVVGETQLVRTDASFECALANTLPVFKDGDLPIYFNAEFGVELVTFSSRDTTLASSITIDNAGASQGGSYFVDPFTLPLTLEGFTSWLHFDVFPTGSSVGDSVQAYINQYNVVTTQYTITGLDQDLSVLELASLVPSTFNLSFDSGVPNPFGRIRIAQVANYSEFKEELDAWLVQPEQQTLYFRDLARLLNPIVTNANPTVSMVNDATNHLKRLLAVLTEEGASSYGSLHTPTADNEDTLEFALASYRAPAVEPVDTLLGTFRQKGADRAIDLLVEGQFSVFFNLNVDGVSYSGALMSGLRDLAREDLPVRKFDRREAGGEKLIGASQDETDFEFSSDDADSPDQPDIPTGPDVASPGENY